MQIIEAKDWKEVFSSEPMGTSMQSYQGREIDECQRLFKERWGFECEKAYHFGTTYVLVAKMENE